MSDPPTEAQIAAMRADIEAALDLAEETVPLREAHTLVGLAGSVTVEPRRSHDSLPSCYAAADVVVVPSVVDSTGDRDGLPNVVLEAMASARPVVASDVGAIGTAVRDGVTGRLVPPGDPEALAAALAGLVDRPDLRLALGAEGRRVVERGFDLAACTAAFRAALEGSHA